MIKTIDTVQLYEDEYNGKSDDLEGSWSLLEFTTVQNCAKWCQAVFKREVSTRTILRYVNDYEQIQAIRIGRVILVDWSSFAQFLMKEKSWKPCSRNS